MKINGLNSVSIEGKITGCAKIPYAASDDGVKLCILTVAHEYDVNTEEFEAEVCGLMAEECALRYKEGAEARLSGRLRQGWIDIAGKPYSRVYIAAEHVEFRPEGEE